MARGMMASVGRIWRDRRGLSALEFALVLPETDQSGAQSVAERIRARVAEFSFLASEGLDVRLTTSVGFASRDSGRQSVTDLLRSADEAMYWVKAHGKNGIHGS